MRRIVSGLPSLLVLVLAASELSGQTTWTGAVSSNWSLGTNWSAGVPTSAIDAIIASATPNAPSTSGVVGATCRALTVNAGATLTIPSGSQLDVGANPVVNGTIAGGGLLRFVSLIDAIWTGSGTIGANVEVAKGATAALRLDSHVTVNGNLTLTSGLFYVSYQANYILSASGNAVLQGGSLTFANLGTLDIAGNVTFSGTLVSGATPTILCGGNWTSDANFAPTSGHVMFDKAGAQTVAAAGALPSVTIASSSSVTTVSSWTVNGPFAVDGSLTMTAGTLDANSSVIVAATGALTLPNGTHTFADNLFVNGGGFTVPGTLSFDQATDSILRSTAVLPSIRIAKTGAGVARVDSHLTASGNLTLVSGAFFVSYQAGYTMAVSGNALLQGGSLSFNNLGTLDVAGNVTFSGTSVAGAAPTIRCGGSFTADANFAPTSGLVVFDGVGAQSVSTAGTFPGVSIESASSITTATALTLNGDLTVNGSLTDSASTLTVNGATTVNGNMSITAGVLDANGHVTVGATGALALGGATHTVSGDFLVNGGALTASGTLVFDQGTDTILRSTAVLPNLRISKTGAGVTRVDSNVTVGGNLTLISGPFFVSYQAGYTMAVSGNALFQGGSLSFNNLGILDVAGNVTFSGTSVTSSSPMIRCGGNWTSNASFAPTSGLVVFDGTGAQSVTRAGTFPAVTIASTSSITTGIALTLNGDLTVAGSFTDSAPTLVVNGATTVTGTMSITSGVLDANGHVTVGAAGALALGGATHTIAGDFRVNGGSLTAAGTLIFDGHGHDPRVDGRRFRTSRSRRAEPASAPSPATCTVNGNLTLVVGHSRGVDQRRLHAGGLGNALLQGGIAHRSTTRSPRRRRQRDVLGHERAAARLRPSAAAATGSPTRASPRPPERSSSDGAGSTTSAPPSPAGRSHVPDARDQERHAHDGERLHRALLEHHDRSDRHARDRRPGAPPRIAPAEPDGFQRQRRV